MVRTVKSEYKPSAKQVEAHMAMELAVLYGGAVGGGKTVWLVNEAIQLSAECPGNIGYLCRHELTSFRRSTLLELEKYLPSELIAQHHQTENYFRLYNGSIIFYGGLGDDRGGLDRIKSMTLGWFGIDQAEETSEAHYDMLQARLRLNLPNIHYKALLTANPAPGWVKHTFIEQKLDDHIFIPALPRDNPYLPGDYEERLRKIYPPEWIKSLLEGDWDALEAGDFLFRYADIKAAVDREVSDEGPKVMGVDIAREGDDESVAVVRKGDRVIWLETWAKANLMFTTGKVGILRDRFEPDMLNLDAVGMGAGVHDRLTELKVPHIAIIAGGTPEDEETYVNIRAEMYGQLQKRFEEGRISIPDDLDLVAQLSSIRFKIASDKRIQIRSKEEMKKTYRVKSPDKADALAMAFLEPRLREPSIRWI